MPSLEKTCQDYILKPTKERINLKELPVDVVVKSVNISQEPTRKHTIDTTVQQSIFHYNIKLLIAFKCLKVQKL